MLVLTISAKRIGPSCPKVVKITARSCYNTLSFVGGLSENSTELESLKHGLLLLLRCQWQRGSGTEKQTSHGPSSTCTIPAALVRNCAKHNFHFTWSCLPVEESCFCCRHRSEPPHAGLVLCAAKPNLPHPSPPVPVFKAQILMLSIMRGEKEEVCKV